MSTHTPQDTSKRGLLTDPLLTTREAAERLNVSTDTVRAMVARGDLPFVRVGPKLVRYRPGDIAALIGDTALTTEREEVVAG